MPQNSICISILVIFSFSTNCRQGLHELCTCAIRCKLWLPDSYYLASMIGILRLLPGGTWPNTLHHNVGLGMRPNVQMRACRGATGTEWYGGCAGAVVLGCGMQERTPQSSGRIFAYAAALGLKVVLHPPRTDTMA